MSTQATDALADWLRDQVAILRQKEERLRQVRSPRALSQSMADVHARAAAVYADELQKIQGGAA